MVFVKTVILFIFFIAVCASYSGTDKNAEIQHGDEYLHIKHEHLDLPKTDDIDAYLEALTGIVDFCKTNKRLLNLNFAFGFLLVNVFLKPVLRAKRAQLPVELVVKLERLVNRNSELLGYMRRLAGGNQPEHYESRAIYSLWSDDTLWAMRLESYEDAWSGGGVGDVSHVSVGGGGAACAQLSWDHYYGTLNDYDKLMTESEESDRCLISLAESSVTVDGNERMCHVYGFCLSMLEFGDNDGYSLTHRLWLLLAARYSKGCSVLSAARDRRLAAKLCACAYSEAAFLARHHNHSALVGLLAEQMALCAVDKHAEFLQRAWLELVTSHRRPEGCFGNLHVDARKRRNKLPPPPINRLPKEQVLTAGGCGAHQTVTAAAALAAALRHALTADTADTAATTTPPTSHAPLHANTNKPTPLY